MPSVRGVATAASNNVIQGDGVAQFSGTRWVEVHAVKLADAESKADIPTAPSVDVEYANGQVTMSKGPCPEIQRANDADDTAMVGFSEMTRIFEGWVQGTPEAEQVLKIAAPAGNGVYWQFSHRAQP